MSSGEEVTRRAFELAREVYTAVLSEQGNDDDALRLAACLLAADELIQDRELLANTLLAFATLGWLLADTFRDTVVTVMPNPPSHLDLLNRIAISLG